MSAVLTYCLHSATTMYVTFLQISYALDSENRHNHSTSLYFSSRILRVWSSIGLKTKEHFKTNRLVCAPSVYLPALLDQCRGVCVPSFPSGLEILWREDASPRPGSEPNVLNEEVASVDSETSLPWVQILAGWLICRISPGKLPFVNLKFHDLKQENENSTFMLGCFER